jgi:hypothetical protein
VKKIMSLEREISYLVYQPRSVKNLKLGRMTKAETPVLINRKRNDKTPSFTSTNQEIFIIDTCTYLNIEALQISCGLKSWVVVEVGR